MGAVLTKVFSQTRNKGAGHRNRVATHLKAQEITIGVTLCRLNIIDVYEEGTMALKDIIIRQVGFQGGQCGAEFPTFYLAVCHVAH